MSSAEIYTNGRGTLIAVRAEGIEVTNALQTCSAVPMQSDPDLRITSRGAPIKFGKGSE